MPTGNIGPLLGRFRRALERAAEGEQGSRASGLSPGGRSAIRQIVHFASLGRGQAGGPIGRHALWRSGTSQSRKFGAILSGRNRRRRVRPAPPSIVSCSEWPFRQISQAASGARGSNDSAPLSENRRPRCGPRARPYETFGGSPARARAGMRSCVMLKGLHKKKEGAGRPKVGREAERKARAVSRKTASHQRPWPAPQGAAPDAAAGQPAGSPGPNRAAECMESPAASVSFRH